jgi:ribulose-5-phosphate 4-epimerase/fuculose-1-phosphate aldolase
MTDNNYADLRQGIVDTCREMNRNGLNQGTSGNLSHRIPNGMLITPTSLSYDRMQSEEVVAMDFAANYQGNHRPSSYAHSATHWKEFAAQAAAAVNSEIEKQAAHQAKTGT